MKKVLTVLDFGPQAVIALVVQKNENNLFQVIGFAEAEARGMKLGQIVNLGDAVEAVVEVIAKVRQQSGAVSEKIYVNFDDPQMQSIQVQGSRVLKGEGEIQPSDVDEACEVAERLITDFERRIVYFKEIYCVIDGKDRVTNPVGIFGSRLDVVVHALRARSERYESWKKLIDRSQIGTGVLVSSLLSTAYGILPGDDRIKKRLIIDLGQDYLNFFIFSNNAICDSITLPKEGVRMEEFEERVEALSREVFEKNPGVEEVRLTGELAQEETVESLKTELRVPVFLSMPLGLPKLNKPKFSSLVGLLYAADELEKKAPLYHRRGLLLEIKEKTVAFINEYF